MHVTSAEAGAAHPGAADAPALHGDLRQLTFLATDIVGSSEMHRRFPDDMLAAMDLHDELLHGAIRRNDGDPFKHTGDGVVAVFDNPLQALRAAADAQLAMRNCDWPATGRPRLRCGIYTGMARPRGDDFFGPALAAVNRLEGAANADQIILSETTVDLVGDAIDGTALRFGDLGEHHFKGIDKFRVFQLEIEGLPNEFGPISGKRETSHGNLPAKLSSFLGREHEVNLLQRMTELSRIVTLVGAGGIGKTRLGLELVRSLEPGFPGGGWILQLSALERETDLWPVMATTLEIEAVPGADRRLQVLDQLRDAKTILLIDNCEHMLDQVADMVVELCAACRELTIVNTSRQMLGIGGEAVYEVPSLEPDPEEDPNSSTAVRLFVERARLVNVAFDPTEAETAIIRDICRNLDYIPLAIEIAAGQVRRFPLDRIAQDAQNPLDLRPGKAQRRADRQQTLRRTLQWSYDLIDDTSRKVLQRLTVFSGPFHEEQALAVCAGDMPDEIEVLDSMDELIDASLLSARVDGSRRVRLLRTVQAFGRDKLMEAGKLEAVEHQHGEVFAARCRDLSVQFAGEEERNAVGAILDDLTNIRAAFERALTRDLDLAARLTEPLFLFNYYHREAETAAWAARIMDQAGAEDLPQAPLLLAGAASHALHELGDPDAARTMIMRGQALEAAGAQPSRGWLPHIAGQVAFWSRETDVFLNSHKLAIEQARAHGDVACEVVDTSMAAFVLARTKDGEGARKLVESLAEVAQTVRQPSLIGYTHFARGGLASLEDFDEALIELQAAVEWAEIGGNHLGAQRTNRIIADIKAISVAPQEALQIQIKALNELPEHGATIYNWTAISRLLAPLAKLRADEELAVITGALEGSPLQLGTSAQRYIAMARDRMGVTAFAEAAARGKEFDQAEARAYAIEQIGGRI